MLLYYTHEKKKIIWKICLIPIIINVLYNSECETVSYTNKKLNSTRRDVNIIIVIYNFNRSRIFYILK